MQKLLRLNVKTDTLPLLPDFSDQRKSYGHPTQVVLVVKNQPANAGDIREMDSILG